jgi:apolipoprotein N-acyltransferase
VKFLSPERAAKLALAVLSGVLLAAAFPKLGVTLLALVALLPLLIALQAPRTPRSEPVGPGAAFRLGYITGAVFFLTLLYWIPFLPRENVTIPFLMIPAVFLMAAYLALFPAAAAMVAVWLARRGLPLGLALPPAWALTEALRGFGTFGFPWGSLGYTFASYPHFIQFAEFTGVWGVTLWVVLVNGLIHLYLETPWIRPKVAVFVFLIASVVVPYLHGRTLLLHREPRAAVEVGLVQPNIGDDKWRLSVRDSVVASVIEITRELGRANAAHPPDLYVWPETAVPSAIRRNPIHRARVEALVDSLGVPLLAGFPDGERLPDGSIRYSNSAALFLPGRGAVRQYDKRHLVPMSEYFPLPILNRHDFGQSNFTPGKEPGTFPELEVPFGVLICFESIFPGYARELCRGGARYLVNITNDQWFGDSAAPYQHFEMNVLRCIENRTGMARAANTGISAVIDPYGIPGMRTQTFVRDSLVAPVELRTGLTLYTRWGDWILAVCAAWLLLFAGVALRRGRGA